MQSSIEWIFNLLMIIEDNAFVYILLIRFVSTGLLRTTLIGFEDKLRPPNY